MNKQLIAIMLITTLALSGCARLGANQSGPGFFSPTRSPAQTTAAAISATNVLTFINSSAAPQLTSKERAEAASAQFYALQFGRPGAPRNWQGESGAIGRVSVGPYVRVNALDCRDFTHSVTIEGKQYDREGTACREEDGSWSVVDT